MQEVKEEGEKVLESNPFFVPALWRQRRQKFIDILQLDQVTSVGDLGCGEGSLLSLLVPCSDDMYIERLVGLDKSSEALSWCWDNCKPWPTDYENKRERPLQLKLLEGSCALIYPSFFDLDAIVMSEVVEHLDPIPLENFPKVVLGAYRPKLFFMSTPNADFNRMFPNLNYLLPNQKFRDEDHRFEWTRREFEQWANDQAQLYNYKVEFTGVGTSPQSIEQGLGFCTQFAIFHRNDTNYTVQQKQFAEEKVFKLEQFPCYSGPYQDQILLDRLLTLLKYELKTVPTQNQFKVSNYWSCIIIRQQCRTLIGFLNYLKDSLRNQGYFELVDELYFNLTKELEVEESEDEYEYE